MRRDPNDWSYGVERDDPDPPPPKVWQCEGDPDGWDAFIAEMHSGRVFECDEEMYYYWLEVLPPAWMNRSISTPVGPRRTFGFAEGEEKVVAFWTQAGRYFGWQTDVINEGG